ncbi:MAG: hypothetical protein DBX07_08060 [Candidatus Poseidoniales archaeon]|uniref:Uncharacterized protein n=1 Tax=uncultured Poseidoniia archaeon TaxID=1697135 RepID=A0A0R7K415_9ARCH|nr:hypothetical protein [uncultured Candidatus Thalassoarchaea sp.]MDA7603284.1 hypothetical protein [Euryarchaeota archaeon]RCH72709.1 MAG: hypothetical protein DBX07_08060 [Candidatus Poseidoniales archaeon]
MILLPDYPDRVIREHRVRVERIALSVTFLLIFSASWWLFSGLFGSPELLSRLGPISLIFISSLVVIDLIDYGLIQKSRIGVIANICYPTLLALSISNLKFNDVLISGSIYFLMAVFLWFVAKKNLSITHSSRRWRGLTSILGLAFSASVMYSISSEIQIYMVVFTCILITMIPDLLSKDENHKSRKDFIKKLDLVEEQVLLLRSQGISLEQASSILKKAREDCWNEPEKGLTVILLAEEEIERVKALANDLDDIKQETHLFMKKAESIAPGVHGPRKAFESGQKESDFGSLREAEILFRLSKKRSEIIIQHWQNAMDEIASAEELISYVKGITLDSINNIIDSAKEALGSENPVEAIKIASSVPGHLESLESTTTEAKEAIIEAEKAIQEVEGSFSVSTKERLVESKVALESGNSSLAKGLATSILRDINKMSESMQNVQRGLRQRKKLTAVFPSGKSGDQWRNQLEDIETKVNSEQWVEASDLLESLTKNLQQYEKSRSEALELYSFVESEWIELRKKLDSSNIKVNDSMRMNAESKLSESKKLLEEGDIDSTLSSLGKTDEIMENLRRRI